MGYCCIFVNEELLDTHVHARQAANLAAVRIGSQNLLWAGIASLPTHRQSCDTCEHYHRHHRFTQFGLSSISLLTAVLKFTMYFGGLMILQSFSTFDCKLVMSLSSVIWKKWIHTWNFKSLRQCLFVTMFHLFFSLDFCSSSSSLDAFVLDSCALNCCSFAFKSIMLKQTCTKRKYFLCAPVLDRAMTGSARSEQIRIYFFESSYHITVKVQKFCLHDLPSL